MLAKGRELKVAVGFLIAAVVVIPVDTQSSCRTPHKRTGVCVPRLTCGTIIQLLMLWSNPLPSHVVQFVQQSQCGNINGVIYVCCEQNSVTFGRASPPTTTTPRSTTTVLKSEFNSRIHRSDEKSDADVQSGMAILEATKCGHSDKNRIGNGKDVRLSEFPWMALLVYDDGMDKTMDCGGSLITDRHVLTAAHCIKRGLKLVSVRLGEHDTNTTEDCTGRGRKRTCAPDIQEIDIEEAIYHKDYDLVKMSNDIGLIRLISKAIFRSNVKPICLPITQQSQAATLDRMIIAGWGLKTDGVKANILQKAVVPMKHHNFCKRSYPLIRVTDEQLCAGGENEVDTCMGDSGGPLFFNARYRDSVRYVQYGVVTAGSKECGTNFPDVFVKVVSYLPWIAGNLWSQN